MDPGRAAVQNENGSCLSYITTICKHVRIRNVLKLAVNPAVSRKESGRSFSRCNLIEPIFVLRQTEFYFIFLNVRFHSVLHVSVPKDDITPVTVTSVVIKSIGRFDDLRIVTRHPQERISPIIRKSNAYTETY